MCYTSIYSSDPPYNRVVEEGADAEEVEVGVDEDAGVVEEAARTTGAEIGLLMLQNLIRKGPPLNKQHAGQNHFPIPPLNYKMARKEPMCTLFRRQIGFVGQKNSLNYEKVTGNLMKHLQKSSFLQLLPIRKENLSTNLQGSLD